MRWFSAPTEARAAESSEIPDRGQPEESAAWRWVLAALFAVSCLQIWVFPYFPSQDGPSHSYNAAILARYTDVPAWREYFRIEGIGFGGSLASHVPLRLLLLFLPAAVAEKVLVTVLLGCFFLAFRSLLRAAGGTAGLFSPFIAMAAHNYFLYMGFWSFYASLAAALWTVGLLLRSLENRWIGGPAGWPPARGAPRPAVAAPTRAIFTRADVPQGHWGSLGRPEPGVARAGLLAAASAATYACHLAGWMILSVAAAAIGLSRLAGAWTRHADARRAAGRIVAAVSCCLWPAVIFVAQLDWSAPWEDGPAALSLRDRLWQLYSLSPLIALHWDELPAVKVLAAGLAAVLCAAAALCWRRRTIPAEPGLLLAAAACAVLGLYLPDAYGGGGFIRERFIFPAILFGVAALGAAAGGWPRAARIAVFSLLLLACALSWGLRLPRIAEFNRLLKDCARIISRIPAGTVVLPIGPPSPGLRVDPFVHAISHGCIRGAVNLGNYEASYPSFPVQFQPQRNPIPSLWTRADQLAVPPRFDIARYERLTGGRVDFVLLRADWRTRRISVPPGLEQFEPEAGGPPSLLLLLRRVRGNADRADARAQTASQPCLSAPRSKAVGVRRGSGAPRAIPERSTAGYRLRPPRIPPPVGGAL